MSFVLTDAVRERLTQAVGADAVRTDEATLDTYADPFPVAAGAATRASAVISPTTVEDVQAVVRIANELGVPLWTVSRGKNNAYGGASPRVPGSVIIELSRMNRILEVDADLGYAVLEPGVTFFQLADHLKERDIPLWPSVPQLGWGSVVGNGLDRGLGYTAYGEHASQQCGYEVVLADGSLLRTGMGAMPGNETWHTYRPGFGIAVDGLFQQSNLGIVVRSGVWLMPRPETFAVVNVMVDEFEQIAALVDALRPLSVDGTIGMGAVITNVVLAAATIAPRVRWYDGGGALPEPIRAQIKQELGVGEWVLTFGVYGSSGRVDDDVRRVKAAFGAIPGARIDAAVHPGDVDPDLIPGPSRVWAAIAGMHAEVIPRWRERGASTGAHTSFSPVLPQRGSDALEIAERMRAAMTTHGFDYTAAFHIGPRYISHVVEIIWDGADPEVVAGVAPFVEELIEDAAAHGQAEYRAHVAFMDRIASEFTFGDHALLRVQERIKDALDPNGILSPGKSGVWPASMRGE